MQTVLTLALLSLCLAGSSAAERQVTLDETVDITLASLQGPKAASWGTNSLWWVPGLANSAERIKAPAKVLEEKEDAFHRQQVLAGRRLIRVDEQQKPRWVLEADTLALKRAGVRFMDITDTVALDRQLVHAAQLDMLTSPLPRHLQHQDAVKPIFDLLSTDYMNQTLTRFTEFSTRYYKSESGRQSCEWLFGKVSEVANGASMADSRLNVTVSYFDHPWTQSSIIARVESTQKPKNDETIIISAHQDSINMWLPWFGRAPGADDDGSGTVTILNAFRALLTSKSFDPDTPVEFHWYSGEEAGLLGSQAVAQEYARQKRKVLGMMQMDMTGFYDPSKRDTEVVGIVSDHTDPELSDFLRKLVTEYTHMEPKALRCGYACSDHASWNKAGYRSAMSFEDDDLEANSHIHSPSDTIDTINFDHCQEFSKIAIGFVYELSHKA